MDLSYPRKCMLSIFACINRDGQMKSGKYGAFWWTCYEIWNRWAIKWCQKTWGRRRIISNNRDMASPRPDRSMIELNTSFTKADVFMRKAHGEHVDGCGQCYQKRAPPRWLPVAMLSVPCARLCACVCVFLFFCVARAICAMCLTLFLCVLRSVFGLVRL